MKFRSIALLPVLAALAVTAADDAGIPVTSQSADFDLKNGVFHYWGGVTVDAPGVLKLNCEDLVALIPAGGGRLDRLVASNAVVIEVVRPPAREGGEPVRIRATGAHAVYTAADEIVTLTGGTPRLEAPQGTTTGDTIIYELNTGRVRALGRHRTLINPDAFRNSGLFGGRTNTPAAPR